MEFSELTGEQVGELSRALVKAFPTKEKLKEVIKIKFNKSIDEISDGTLTQRTMDIIEAAEAEGWTAKLIKGARAHNPGNPALHEFYLKYAVSVQRSFSKHDLERIVNDSAGFEDIVAWREKLAQIELQVCRVEVRGAAAGTGFLVGDDLVLTNYHVIEGNDLSKMNVRFDHKILADGTTINSGKVYRVIGPAVDQSPYSPFDLSFPPTGAPGADQLDYALLRIEGKAATDTVDGKKRAFMVPTKQAVPSQGLLFIVQHPKGRPLQVAFDAILELNGNGTRITYKTNTEEGSSGSPGFDRDWNLVVLHHSGDPRFGQQAQFNEGIPIETIRTNLKPEITSLLGWA
jgi:hypothetical protein